MLKFDAVEIRQGDFALAVQFEVAAGRKVALIGPSGAGKSTLLGALGGFFPCASGRIIWNGDDMTDARPGARPVACLLYTSDAADD